MLDVSKLSEREALGLLLYICYDWRGSLQYLPVFNKLVPKFAQLSDAFSVLELQEFFTASHRLHFHILLANNTPESLGITDEEYKFLKGLPIE
jgi:hypothetical protein